MDTVFSAAVLGVVIVLVLAEGGANLDAPADPSSADYPARPEWYFLSLFQMLKYFPGSREVIGTIVIPTALLVVMLILPLLDRVLPGKFAHFLACGFVFAVLGGAGFMTVQAMMDDSRNPVFQEARKKADAMRERAQLAGLPGVGIGYDLRLMSSLNDVGDMPTVGKDLILVAAVNHILYFRIFDGDGKMVVDTDEKRLTEQARQIEDLRQQLKDLWPPSELPQSKKGRVIRVVTSIVARGFGIPPDGSAYILRRDPLTHGRAVLERRCLGCHVTTAKGPAPRRPRTSPGSAPGPGSAGCSRIRRRRPTSVKSPSATGWASGRRARSSRTPQLDDIADFVASFAKVPADMTPAEWLKSPGVSSHPGLKSFRSGGECGECHVLAGLTKGGLREAPDLFAWGSPQWLARMIRKPSAADRYGFLEEEQKMPAFGSDQLTPNDLEMVIRYLQGDYVKAGASPTAEKSPTGQPSTPAKSP